MSTRLSGWTPLNGNRRDLGVRAIGKAVVMNPGTYLGAVVDIPATLPPMPSCATTAFAIFPVFSGNL
jgi:hypothetical protein